MKIAVNKCHGGFGVSRAVMLDLGSAHLDNDVFGIVSRNKYAWRAHPKLIEAIEKVGVDAASDLYAQIEIVQIPDGVEWEICAYDGFENVREAGRHFG